MGTRTIMWLFLGAILLIGGLIGSMDTGGRQGSEGGPGPANVREPLANRISDTRSEKPAKAGFATSEGRVTRSRNENAEYFR